MINPLGRSILPTFRLLTDRAALAVGTPLSSRTKILVAEDVAPVRAFTGQVLTMSGYDVDLVTNGVEALIAVQERMYDLVLMNIEMPVLDGVAAARRIRALGGHQPLIFAFTTKVDPPQILRYRAAGMQGCIRKVFREDLLLNAVSRLLPLPPKSFPPDPAKLAEKHSNPTREEFY